MKYYKKQMTPQGADYVNTAPLCLTQSTIINAPIEKVWSVIDDTPGYTNWFPGLKWGKFENPKETGLGATRLAQLNSSKYYERMIVYKPQHQWGFTMLESNSGACSSIAEVITLEKISENQTKVTYQGGYALKGFFKLLKGVLTNAINKIWIGALAGMKTYIETGKTVN